MARHDTGLFDLAEEIRREDRNPSVIEILKEAKSRGTSVSSDELMALASLKRRSPEALLPPKFVIEFVRAYFNEVGVKSLLDVGTGVGSILVPLVEKYHPSRVVAIDPLPSNQEIVQWLLSSTEVEWLRGDPLLLIEHVQSQFDAIVGCPPWMMKTESVRISIGGESVKIRDTYENLLLLQSSRLLTESGISLFILPASTLYRRDEYRVISNLHKFGLYLNAALHLPSGSFSPTTSIGGLLVIVSRKPSERLFVGEITDDLNQRTVLLNNFRASRVGKSPQLGVFVDIETYRSFPSLVQQREIENEARTSGLKPTRLVDLCLATNLAKRGSDADTGFADLPNTVYLPTIGNSPAVTSQGNLRIKPHNYVQLVLDSERVHADYLAQFFNTSLGYKIRESFTSGEFIPKITKASLADAYVFIPELNTQIEVISTQAAITDIASKLESLNRDLWRRPRKYREIQKTLRSMQPTDTFEKWLESLPFPLASILWAYAASGQVDRKIEHLFFFFEALAEFIAVLLLSAYAADKDFYAQESGAWIDKDPKYQNWILTSDFGGWRILGERLARVTRTLKEDEEKKQVVLRLFGWPSSEFLEMLTSKGMFAILKRVNEYRDQWKGHSGVLSDVERKQHLSLLESSLSEMRNVMQDRWESVLLLKPGSNEYSEGLYEYQIKALVGTRTQFKQKTVTVLAPMDKNKIYLLHDGQQVPVELLPFVQLRESPKTQENAIYFYNRVKDDKIRYVSYHFDRESEVVSSDAAMVAILKLLQPAI